MSPCSSIVSVQNGSKFAVGTFYLFIKMPPRKGAKRPAGGGVGAVPKLTAEAEEINSKLSAVDLLVAEMRSQLEAVMEPCLEDMRKEVAFFLMRLPSRVKNMRMSDFLRECGGDVQLLLEKERKAGKCVFFSVCATLLLLSYPTLPVPFNLFYS
jgi:hypothetical protein